MPLVLRLSIFYASLCLFGGVHLPFFPVWMKDKGLDATEIAIVLSGAAVLRIATGPFFAYVADRWQDRRRMVLLLGWTSVSIVSFYVWTESFWSILLVSLVLMSVFPSVTPLAETIAMRAAREEGVDYGRVRIWCSLAFIAASSGMGWLLVDNPIWIVVPALIGATLLNATGALLLPADPKPARRKQVRGGQFQGAMQLARHKVFVLFLFAASFAQATHSVYYAFGTLNWQRLGYGENLIGALWGIGVIAEIVLFAVSGRFIGRIGPVTWLMLSGAGSIVRWTVMAFDPPLWTLIPLQVLHAFTFGAAHLGAMQFVVQAAPTSLAATAQSLYSTLSAGVILSLAMFAAGPLYATFKGEAYLGAAALGVLTFGLALMLSTRWRGETLIDEEEMQDETAARP